MVNTEDFINRLEAVLDHYSLSASAFADSIGVQRSGLSHLLSGRNKPSLDFIMKIVGKYPDVDIYWLLNGKGKFPIGNDDVEDKNSPQPAPGTPVTPTMRDLFSTADEKIPEAPEALKGATINLSNDAAERVIVFYKNGTFKEYRPQ